MHSPHITIDVARHTVEVSGQSVDLGPKEFGVLSTLAKAKGKVLSRQQILQAVWGPEEIAHVSDTRSVDQQIARTRRALCKAGRSIVTVTRGGYKLLNAHIADDKQVRGRVTRIRRHFGAEVGSTVTLFVNDAIPAWSVGDEASFV